MILDSTRSTGFSAVKLTALGRPNLLVSRLRRDQDIGRGKSREFKIHHMNPKFPKNPPQKFHIYFENPSLKFTLIHVKPTPVSRELSDETLDYGIDFPDYLLRGSKYT